MGSMNNHGILPMQEGINEVIATTFLNAAPMGIICRNGELMMAIYRTSHTAAHIEEEGCVVANIMHDPVLFVKTAFDDLTPDEFIEEVIDNHRFWRLKGAVSWVAYAARVGRRTDQKILVSLTPVYTVLSEIPLVPVNRGLNSVIEAAVHGTRYILNRDPALKDLIDHHANLIKRCGGKPENQALKLLLDYIS